MERFTNSRVILAQGSMLTFSVSFQHLYMYTLKTEVLKCNTLRVLHSIEPFKRYKVLIIHLHSVIIQHFGHVSS